MILYLDVFDFDGTLFKSPLPPDWWKDKAAWFYGIESLSPPFIPEIPSSDWWIEPTVRHAIRALSDVTHYVILLTGRNNDTFVDRISQLLEQKELEFDEVHLSDRKDTVSFKVDNIQRVLSEHPSIKQVSLWDDQIERTPAYQAAVERLGIKFKLHMVNVEEIKSPCTEDEFLSNKVVSRYTSLV
jgi:hypothetical protein